MMDVKFSHPMEYAVEVVKDPDSDLHTATLLLFDRPVASARNTDPHTAKAEVLDAFTAKLAAL